MYSYRLVLLLLITGYLFLPWLSFGLNANNWYQPFLIWAGLIALNSWLEQKRRLNKLQ